MKKRKRLLSAALALCLLLSLTPMEVLAEEPDRAEEPSSAETVLPEEPAAPADDVPVDVPDTAPAEETAPDEEATLMEDAVLSGTCGAEGDGSNLRWEIDVVKQTFTVSGKGAMANYSTSNRPPWRTTVSSQAGTWHLNIIVEEGVTTIGNYAFADFIDDIGSSITLPSTLTSIGDYAFFWAFNQSPVSGPTEMVIPSGVTYIGRSAFGVCVSLKKVVIQNPDTVYGLYAFSGCKNLTEVILPEGMKTIPMGFLDSSGITSIHLPDSVTAIESLAFRQCNSLVSIDLPSGLTSIGDNAFYCCKELSSISGSEDGILALPDTVQTIGKGAFVSCLKITGIHWPAALQSVGETAFEVCGFSGHLTIPDGVTFGRRAFRSCYQLTSVTLPSDETRLGDALLESCTGLTSIAIPSTWTCIPRELCLYCRGLTTCVIPDNIREIGLGAFQNCTSLVSVTIPDSVTSIWSGAFSGCTSLVSCSLPHGITTIRSSVFDSCTSLVNCPIPDSVTTIDLGAFEDCTSLPSFLVMPASVTTIKAAAFLNSSVKSVRFLGDAPTTINDADISYGSPSFNRDTVFYYTAGKEGWTSPTWHGYSAYVILGEGSYEFHDADYYASLALRNFDFQAHLGPHQGEGVKNVTLSYQGNTISANEGETSISAAIKTEPDTKILFTQANMHDVSLPVEVLSTFNTIQFHPKTGLYPATKPFVQAIYGQTVGEEYTDLLHQTLTLYAGSLTEKVRLYIDVNWVNQESDGTLYLSQTLDPADGVKVQEGFNDPTNISIKLKADKPLYLLMVCDDDNNTVLSQQLSVSILTEDTNFLLDLGADFDVPSPDEQLLSQFDFDVKLPKDISITMSVENDGTVSALLGVQLAKDQDIDEVFGSMRDQMEYEKYRGEDGASLDLLKSVLEERGGITMANCSFVTAGTASLVGYAEGKLIHYDNGQYGIVFSKGTVGLAFEGSVKQTFQLYAASVPFYVSGNIKPKVTFNITLYSNAESTEFLVNPIDVKGTIALKVAGGLGWDSIASAGIYGSGTGTVEGTIPIKKGESSCYVQGKIGAEAAFFCFSADLTIFEGKKTYLWGGTTPASLSLASLAEADWQPQSRQYLGTAPDLGVSLLEIGEENTVLTSGLVTSEGIYPYAAVQTAVLSGGRQVAVWTNDPGTRSAANNRTVLYYSYYDGTAWTTPAPVEAADDGTADFNPRLKVLNDTAYLVWQDAVRALTASDTQDTTPALMDISCAVFDDGEGAFTTLGTVGTDYYDTTADVVLLDSQPAVVWTSNSGNSALIWSGAICSLHRQVLGSEMETLAANLYQVDGLVADGSQVWFSADTDGDSETLADREIFHCDGSTLERLTNNDAADTKPTLTGGQLAWYSGGTVVCGGNTVALAADTDRYQYVRSDTGMEAIVYLEDDEVRKTTLYASFNDGSGWGDPIALTGTTGNIGSFSAVFLSDGTLFITACERGLDATKANYLSISSASLTAYSVTPYCDLAIERVAYLEQSLVKGGTLDVPVQVVNNGMANVDLMEIQVLNGTTQVASSVLGASLASGQSGTFYVSVPLGDTPADYKDLTVTVSAMGYTEHTEEDNSAALTLRLSDVSVEGAVASSDGSTTQVKALVVNRGQTDLGALTVRLYGEDGAAVLPTQTVAAPAIGEGTFVTFQVNESFANNTLLTVEATAAGLEVIDENIASNNTYTALVKGPKAAAFTVSGSAIAGEDGTITAIASVSNTTETARSCTLYFAAYNADGRMLASQVAGDVLTESGAISSQQVKLKASGASVIRVFALDENGVPLIEAVEYSL